MTTGFPARAGMDPVRDAHAVVGRRIPRTRGDGPATSATRPSWGSDSPHARGWTRRRARPASADVGFPARAGMDPRLPCGRTSARGIPRTRGDGPGGGREGRAGPADSPHARGWTRRARPARPGRRGFPARAGMDPGIAPPSRSRVRIPRTRGDGPCECSRRERPAGDSPHARGWTRAAAPTRSRRLGFPARAGMDPPRSSGCGTIRRIPRTRGDGPGPRTCAPWRSRDSPHARGWTRGRMLLPPDVRGFPARAGMDPATPPA